MKVTIVRNASGQSVLELPHDTQEMYRRLEKEVEKMLVQDKQMVLLFQSEKCQYLAVGCQQEYRQLRVEGTRILCGGRELELRCRVVNVAE